MKRNWIAFFSRSGSEIAYLCEKLGTRPVAVVTNKTDLSDISEDLRKLIDDGLNIVHISNKPSVEEYQSVFEQYDNPLVTLHGYLRVVPQLICEKYEIYNLHPGLINEYPDLKGLDPQKRAIDKKYKLAGCVIHRVTPGVDEGEIIISGAVRNGSIYTEEQMIFEMASVAKILWTRFFKPYVN